VILSQLPAIRAFRITNINERRDILIRGEIMEDMLIRFWNNLIGRPGGPLSLRLFLQPLMASIFAIRAALKDAREDRPPYLWAIFRNPAERRNLLREGWKDVGKIFVIAILIDLIYQIIAFRWFYPVESLVLATILALVPYALIRGPLSRIMRRLGIPPRDQGAER
jgi:hypothetical protein